MANNTLIVMASTIGNNQNQNLFNSSLVHRPPYGQMWPRGSKAG